MYLLAVLGLSVAASEWLARHTPLRHLGSALLVIVLTAIVANLGVIPTYGDDVPIYNAIFTYVGPLAIFFLLLRVNLRGLLRAGPSMIVLFLVGAAGTVAGVAAGMWVVGGVEQFGRLHHALAGMFVGTYTGGSINFNAVALHYGVVREGMLYAGAAAVDSAATTVWMAATVALPRLLRAVWPAARLGRPADSPAGDGAAADDREAVGTVDVALLMALGGFAVWLSGRVADWLRDAHGTTVPSILVLTTLALVLAQIEPVRRLRGSRLCGWFAVMVFLAVIGALCDVEALRGIGGLGGRLIVFVAVTIGVHGAVVFGTAALLRFDVAMAAVASQANIGGSTSALALARSLGRSDLAVPAILVGALGNAIGTYLGFVVAGALA